MNVLLCESTHSPLTAVAELLQQAPDVNVVSIARTGRDAIDVLTREPVDVSIHSEDTVELSRFIRDAIPETVSSSVSRVVASPRPTTPLLVKAHQFGFDGVIAVPKSPDQLASELVDVLSRRSSLSEHPVIRSLNLTPGILTRTLAYSNQLEAGIADLVGIGLSDREIAETLQLSLQAVRNHIEQLLRDNQLSTRTQLAVLHAINWSIPDFA